VKKIGRALLIIAGAMLAFIAVMLVAVNLYVQSQGTQARIQRELSERLGATLRIDRISVTPWWGLKLTGITMPQSDASVTGDFLKADTFRLRIRFL
jgi:sulfite exporter TauE/SafE